MEQSGGTVEERLIRFAVDILKHCEALPCTFAGRHIGEQLLRAGTACPANYAEARGAESRRDFVHKLGVVRKKLNECRVWLRLIDLRQLVSEGSMTELLGECEQLCKIISASQKTAKMNLEREEGGKQ